MNILVIVPSRHEARQAGASPATLRHRSAPEIQFWYPQLGTGQLQGRRFDVIVCDPDARLTAEQHDLLRVHSYNTALWIKGLPVSLLVSA